MQTITVSALFSLVTSLVVAWLTGGWRKTGRRMERLCELRDRWDQSSDLYQLFNAAAEQEARRLARRGLTRSARAVRQALLVVVFVGSFYATFWLTDALLVPRSRAIGWQLGITLGEQARQQPGVSPTVLLVGDLVGLALVTAGSIAVVVLVVAGISEWWRYSRASRSQGTQEPSRSPTKELRAAPLSRRVPPSNPTCGVERATTYQPAARRNRPASAATAFVTPVGTPRPARGNSARSCEPLPGQVPPKR